MPTSGCASFEYRGVAMEIRRLRSKYRILRQTRAATPPALPPQQQYGTAVHAPTGAAGFVRPLSDADIPQIAELQERLMPKAAHLTTEAIREYLAQLMLGHPWPNEFLTSLVY